MGFDEMSAYDRAAWDACLKAVYDSRARRLVSPRVRELTGKASKVVSAGYEKARLATSRPTGSWRRPMTAAWR